VDAAPHDDEARVALADLPDAVRSRVVSLTADVLPDVVRLPPALRRVAAFAPARRARLGAVAIVAALEGDEGFHDRVATQVTARAPRDTADPAEQAALAWLSRPDGWQVAVADAVRRLAELPGAAGRDTSEVDRLRGRAAEADRALRDLKALHRAQLDEFRAENSSLRRKLGESRAAERAARAALEDTARADDEERVRGEAQAAAQDKELRRLRAQVAQLEADAAAGRRATRTERDDTTVRARVLLDTVLEAAAGLRRELALPAVTGAPGDRVEADLADDGGRTPGAPGGRGPGSPALLEQYLTMPRARLVVDGYNVSKTAWPSSSLEAQRIRLLNGLAPIVARTGVETTVVFDAAASSTRPVVQVPRGVKVVFSPEGVIADDVIRDLVAAEPEGRVLVVVTSDRAVAEDVVRAGARSASADVLIGLLARST
jgi:predicted RNA-binding protein with PIN domain